MTVSVKHAAVRVPSSFLGLSVENNELFSWTQWRPAFVRMIDVLRPPATQAPVQFRVGGESADSSFWNQDDTQVVAPAYQQGHPYVVNQAWMSDLGDLVRAAHLNVLFDLNLASHSPEMAAHVATAARNTLPAKTVSAFEIGNEPDLYHVGLVGDTRAEHGGPNEWAFSFSSQDYDSLFGDYAHAIGRVFPGAKLAGPSTMSRSTSWATDLINSGKGHRLSMVTVHSYPLFDGCPGAGDPPPPQASDYLRDSASAGVARTERFVVAASRAAKLPVRVDEVGSATCGGTPGESDTYATALWAPDLFFNLVLAGVQGINVHLRTSYPNTALSYTSTGIYAEPLFYGMALFARTLGPGARLMDVQRSGGDGQLKVWAVRLGNGSLHVLYINKSRRGAVVKLRWHSRHVGTLTRLSAPTLKANQTVTLAGQRLSLQGLWQGTPRVTRVPVSRHSYRVSVPALSAALLSVG